MDVIFAICLALRFRISFLHPITKKAFGLGRSDRSFGPSK